ncbi:MAG: ABC transporter permease [Rhodospirillales bacterium]|nr:ABC transporter permease [Rhodospirillales bacterium]
MTRDAALARARRRGAVALIAAAALYQATTMAGLFPAVLLPGIPHILATGWRMAADGRLLHDAAATLWRVVAGFVLALALGLPLGAGMARFRWMERFFLPLVNALMPIPSFALVPLFILWSGIGDRTTILVVFYAATFPVLFNTYTGVRAVNPLWLRAAAAMGAGEGALFAKVILPGAAPFIIAALRQGFLRAWIAVIGAEMIAAANWGLGWVIFDAQQFLQTGEMMVAIVMIGLIGFAFERLLFGPIERATVMRWGMVRTGRS